MRALGLALALAALPGAASAHLVGTEFGGFYAGAAHLATDPGQLAMLAGLGLACAIQPREAARWCLLVLPLTVGIGALATALGSEPPPFEPSVAIGLLVAGVIAIAALPVPALVLVALTGALGLVVGALNGSAALGGDVPLWLYLGGVTAAAMVIGTLTIAVLSTLVPSHPLAPLGARVAGSWLTAIGAVSMVLSLTAAG